MSARVDRCPRCLTAGFTLDKGWDGRPRFTCTNGCGSWTSGKSGAPYLGHEMKIGGRKDG